MPRHAPPFPFLRLPDDIRTEIYRLCFARPLAIVPTTNHYKDWYGELYAKYHYQWEGTQDQSNVVRRRGDWILERIPVIWSSPPTSEQAHHLSITISIPDTVVGDGGCSNIRHEPRFKPNGSVKKIVNTQYYKVSGIIGARLLATCKQIQEEAAQVLYGFNTFSFDSTQAYHLSNVFNFEPHPAIESIFESPEDRQSSFVLSDPLLYFLSKIGRKNAALLTSIKIRGEFKAEFPNVHGSRLSFGHLLPIYTMVLGEVGQNLRNVNIDGIIGDGVWDENLRAHHSQTDDQIIDRILRSIVEGLPHLEELILGHRRAIHGTEHITDDLQDRDDRRVWGEALRWIAIVKQRVTEPESEVSGDNHA